MMGPLPCCLGARDYAHTHSVDYVAKQPSDPETRSMGLDKVERVYDQNFDPGVNPNPKEAPNEDLYYSNQTHHHHQRHLPPSSHVFP